MFQEMFLKGSLITLPEIFLQGFEDISLHFQLLKTYFQEMFFKPFLNISWNVSLEKVYEKKFGIAWKTLQ